MRKDMYKVIVERPRHWKGGDSRAARRRDDHDGPTHLGMRVGYGYRSLNENLAPLRRYLLAQVGRPWDKVFSEICAGIDRRNTVQQHIHQHIEDFIATRVAIRDEELIDLSSPFRHAAEISQPLYVDPRTGLIRINKKYRRGYRGYYAERKAQEQAEMAACRRVLDERTLLLRLEELWFEVKLAELPASQEVLTLVKGRRRIKVIVERRYDAVFRRETSRAHTDWDERKRLYGARDLYAVSKRQLSTRELKAHGLRE
ncbi:hypothetical protein ACFPN2_21960 [Steroidobacter flavus]|uniref:Uncharacterized protein n=1 Tax=Steroidobacter flavus TaxID=1842136 RepID=A0ABV8SX76_9GAMM